MSLPAVTDSPPAKMPENLPAEAGAPALTVYYDGSCPVCSREIALYRGCEGADAIVWTDITKATGDALAPDLSRAEAMARFHVRRADGSLVDGGRAFAEIWQALPRFRRAGRLFASGVGARLIEVAYRLWLRVMPLVRRFGRPASQG
ncbi:thiol-disulfide oxidoreductase DCC family protein [Blastochloris tepida]|uniref:Thiol-disulfide oxidoreductase n=1 Tax=Blastochloris tepida TaxID=2233851 RepID=A0A348FVW2_9HYPH|nr:DUF393 domain-containing protein [Blastochloris tepida]BBF91445.1 hypothetical protein BLTE_01300 [Blastochloris tepida]